LEHIFTVSFMDNMVYLGGGGATLGLVLVLGYLARKKKPVNKQKCWLQLQWYLEYLISMNRRCLEFLSY